jgi:hypothetical protein
MADDREIPRHSMTTLRQVSNCDEHYDQGQHADRNRHSSTPLREMRWTEPQREEQLPFRGVRGATARKVLSPSFKSSGGLST